MAHVRLVVQECKPGTVESLTPKAQQTLVPRIPTLPGLVSYEIAKVDDRTILATGIFDTHEHAEQLERMGAQWRKDVGKDDIVSVQVHFGEIILHAEPKPKEVQVSV